METALQIGLSNALVATALALIAVVVGYFYRRPALVHCLWLLVLLKLVTPPLVPIPIVWPATPVLEPVAVAPESQPSDTALLATEVPDAQQESDQAPRLLVVFEPEPALSEPAAEAPAMTPVEPPAAPFPWQMLLAGIWLTGSAGWFLLAGWRVLRFRRLLRFAQPAPTALCKMAERLARKMQLPACPAIYLIPGQLAPMLWAMGGNPLLLIPRDLLGHLTLEQQETLLAHELAHLRRRDHWVRGLEFVAMGLYWWHPLLWYARRELREAEEQCCDAWVVSLLPGAGKTYATALLETLEFLSNARPATPLLASGIGQVSDLKRRLRMILCGSTPRGLTWPTTLAVMVLGLCVLPLLPTLVRAQTKETQEQVERELAQQRELLAKQQDDLDQAAQYRRAEAELQKAKAELAKLQADLQLKMAQVKQAEDRYAALKAKSTPEPKPAQQQGVELILRKVGDKWELVQPKQSAVMEFRIEEKGGVLLLVPVDMTKTPIPLKPAPIPVKPPEVRTLPKPGASATDGRIEQLEEQLKKIMDDLDALRKEMKQPAKPGAPPTLGR